MQDKMDIPKELIPEVQNTNLLTKSYIEGLMYINSSICRDSTAGDYHLFVYIYNDFIMSAISIPVLIKEGILNVAKRELRFIIESSIKICYIQQNQYGLSIEKKLEEFKKVLDSPNISPKNNICLNLLSTKLQQECQDDLGRLYGETSKYIHLTQKQVQDRIEQYHKGISIGNERPEDIQSLNALATRIFAISITLLFHSCPEYVAGDFCIYYSSADWYFMKSKYLAGIDEYFDYKAERKDKLNEINEERIARIEF